MNQKDNWGKLLWFNLGFHAVSYLDGLKKPTEKSGCPVYVPIVGPGTSRIQSRSGDQSAVTLGRTRLFRSKVKDERILNVCDQFDASATLRSVCTKIMWDRKGRKAGLGIGAARDFAHLSSSFKCPHLVALLVYKQWHNDKFKKWKIPNDCVITRAADVHFRMASSSSCFENANKVQVAN